MVYSSHLSCSLQTEHFLSFKLMLLIPKDNSNNLKKRSEIPLDTFSHMCSWGRDTTENYLDVLQGSKSRHCIWEDLHTYCWSAMLHIRYFSFHGRSMGIQARSPYKWHPFKPQILSKSGYGCCRYLPLCFWSPSPDAPLWPQHLAVTASSSTSPMLVKPWNVSGRKHPLHSFFLECHSLL